MIKDIFPDGGINAPTKAKWCIDEQGSWLSINDSRIRIRKLNFYGLGDKGTIDLVVDGNLFRYPGFSEEEGKRLIYSLENHLRVWEQILGKN